MPHVTGARRFCPARIWSPPSTTTTITPHWHDAYTVPVIEAGAECYDYRGGHHFAEAGSVPVINPGELYTGARAVDFGWRYRVFYLPVPFVEEMAREVFGSAAGSPWFLAGAIHDADLARRLVITLAGRCEARRNHEIPLGRRSACARHAR